MPNCSLHSLTIFFVFVYQSLLVKLLQDAEATFEERLASGGKQRKLCSLRTKKIMVWLHQEKYYRLRQLFRWSQEALGWKVLIHFKYSQWLEMILFCLLIVRIFWALIFVISMYFCSLVTLQSYQKWKAVPIITNVDKHPTLVTEIPLPAITVCPEIKYNNTVFDLSSKLEELEQSPENVTDEEWVGMIGFDTQILLFILVKAKLLHWSQFAKTHGIQTWNWTLQLSPTNIFPF